MSLHQTDDLDHTKAALRTGFCSRSRLPVPQAVSVAVQERLLASVLTSGVRTVALYRALPSEIATDLLAQGFAAACARVCLPVVVGGERVLRFLLHAPESAMRKSALGVEEPVSGPEIALSEIDLFVVPGLAADLLGFRLGRGRGHYDATLCAAPRALRVMPILESSLVPSVPVGEHDERLDALCTEERLILFPSRHQVDS